MPSAVSARNRPRRPRPPEIPGIAMEIEQHRLAGARRHHPGDEPLAIGRGERHLLGRRQSRRGKIGARGIARIQHLALPDIEKGERAEIGDDEEGDKDPQESHLTISIAWA